MHKLALVVANKICPSWSMRPWVLPREAEFVRADEPNA